MKMRQCEHCKGKGEVPDEYFYVVAWPHKAPTIEGPFEDGPGGSSKFPDHAGNIGRIQAWPNTREEAVRVYTEIGPQRRAGIPAGA